MLYLEQSTAVTLQIGPFLDEDDGKTAETGLTISQADVRLSKNGANIAQKTESTACTHDELGWYSCPIDATDTATLGRLQLMVHESGALPVWHEFMVVPSTIYDSLVLGSDYLQADTVEISSDSTAADNAEAFFDGTGYAGTNNVIPSVTLVDTTTTNTDVRGTDSAALAATALTDVTWTDARAGYLDELAAANLPADIDNILIDTAELQTDDIPTVIGALNNLATTDLDTALSDIHLDHLLATNYDPASKPGTATALLNELIETDGGVSRFTANALEQAPGAAGAGAITFVYTLTSTVDSAPIDGATVWATTDAAGTNPVAAGTTDAAGQVTFYLDAGTYYFWRQKSGWTFTNPDTEVVS